MSEATKGQRSWLVAAWARRHAVLSIAARLLLAAVFVAAAVHKIWDPEVFALNVATYQILPLSLINLQAIGLPWVELIAGVALLSGLFTREAALVTVGMNLMFVVAIGITLYRGEEIMCGCFASGDAGHQIDAGLLVRDAGLLLVGAYLAWVGPRALALDTWLHRRREART